MTKPRIPRARPVELYGEHGEFAYHYTTREAAFEHILPRGRLRMSALASMRDPVENKEWVQQLVTYGEPYEDEEGEEAIQDEADVNAADGAARQTIFNTKLLSFTLDGPEPPDGVPAEHTRGYARPRMWEQYAESHAGVCLIFAREALQEELMAVLPAFNDAVCGRVSYSNIPFLGSERARILDVDHLKSGGDGDIARGLRAHVHEHQAELFFRKLEDWSSEQEFRYLLLDTDAYEVHVPFGSTLRAVIVGEQFPAWQLPGAAQVSDAAGIELRQIQWGPFPPGVFDPLKGRR